MGAIKGGDIASLTNALGGLGGAAPQILGDVLGARLPLSGIDIGGFGAQGGLDFGIALASTFMSTAAAFLECDPPDECPPTDTQTLSSGGESQDESKSEKVNNANIIGKVKENIKPNLGISAEGAQEALNNRLSSVGDKGSFATSALTGDGIIPESIGGFDTSNLTDGNIIPESIGNFDTSSYLPENSFKVTPKKKFNIPNEKVKVKNSSGQKFYADYIAEGVVIEEIGDNDFLFKYPNGKEVISTSLGSSNAPTIEGRFDALVIEKERLKKEKEKQVLEREEEKRRRDEEQRLRNIEWAKKFPNLYNSDGTRKK